MLEAQMEEKKHQMSALIREELQEEHQNKISKIHANHQS